MISEVSINENKKDSPKLTIEAIVKMIIPVIIIPPVINMKLIISC